MTFDLTKPFRRLAPTVDVAPLQTDDQTFRFVFSNERVGRDRFIVLNRAIQHANYDCNPVVLWAHEDKQPPIARGSNIDTNRPDCALDITFVDRGILPFAGTIRDLVAGRWLRAVSLSWLPIKWKRSDSPDVDAIFTEVDMLEVSLTPLPALPGALLEARSHGVDTRPIYDWAEQLLDTGGMAMLPRSELETLRRAAKMTVRASGSTESSEWKVGAARDLEIEDDDSWDGAAAEASIFKWAGGDDFSPSKARKGFLVYDAAKPEERGSYKLPIAQVVDGELKVPKGAIRAAASRLPDTDIPAEVKERAGAVLDHYKKKAGIGEKDDDNGKKRALRAKHARSITRVPHVPTFRRGLCEVAQLAWALHGLGYLHDATEYEADIEGDDSKVPAMLGEALKALGESLIAMTQEEVTELLEEVSGDGDDDVGDAGGADDVAPEERAYVAGAGSARVRAWRRGIAIARAGRVLSKSNHDRLEDADAHHERALKHHAAAAEHHEAVADHLKTATEKHERAAGALEELGEHVRAAQENPDEAKGHLERAARTHKKATEHMGAVAEAHGDADEAVEDLGDSQRCMGRSVKRAQSCVRAVLDNSTPDGDVGDTAGAKPGKKGGKGAGNDPEDDEDEERAVRERLARAHQLKSQSI